MSGRNSSTNSIPGRAMWWRISVTRRSTIRTRIGTAAISRAVRSAATTWSARLADNDKEGIDHQFLFPTQLSIPDLYRGRARRRVVPRVQQLGEGARKGKEDRLWPIGVMPWGHPEALVDELRHCVKTLGFKAIHLTPYSHKHTLDSPGVRAVLCGSRQARRAADAASRELRRADQPLRQFLRDAHLREAVQLHGGAGGARHRRRVRAPSEFARRLLRVQRGVDPLLDAPHGRRLQAHEQRVHAQDHAQAVRVHQEELLRDVRGGRAAACGSRSKSSARTAC